MSNNPDSMSSVAGRYAAAIFELAQDQGVLSETEADFADLRSAIDGSADLRRALESPLFSKDQKAAAISSILDKAGATPLVKNFVGVVAANLRLFALRDIITAFFSLLARHRGEVTADVASAAPLKDAQVAALKETLNAALGREVALNQKVDPSLLGGLVVKVGSRMVDSSLKTKLNRLGEAMRQA